MANGAFLGKGVQETRFLIWKCHVQKPKIWPWHVLTLCHMICRCLPTEMFWPVWTSFTFCSCLFFWNRIKYEKIHKVLLSVKILKSLRKTRHPCWSTFHYWTFTESETAPTLAFDLWYEWTMNEAFEKLIKPISEEDISRWNLIPWENLTFQTTCAWLC